MKNVLKASLIAAMTLAVGTLTASATTIDSSSSTVFYAGYIAPGSSTLHPSGSSTTYNLPDVAPWAAPIGNSSWVSYNPNTYVGGSVVANAGTYAYYTVFSATAGETATISVLADDTTLIDANGNFIVQDATTQGANCTQQAPNCITPATYTTSLVNGTNYIAFGVDQLYGSATGLDFQITVNSAQTPEPSSLLLLATGLTGAAGMLRRRLRA